MMSRLVKKIKKRLSMGNHKREKIEHDHVEEHDHEKEHRLEKGDSSSSSSSSSSEDEKGSSIKKWRRKKEYNAGDCVNYKGKDYECTVGHTSSTSKNPLDDSVHWMVMNPVKGPVMKTSAQPIVDTSTN